MKRKKLFFLAAIGVVFMLFAGTLLYAILRDDDQHKYFTGLGEQISIAPDDSKIAFSYFVDGKESIYTANADGKDIKKVTYPKEHRDHHPEYSGVCDVNLIVSQLPSCASILVDQMKSMNSFRIFA